MRIREILLVLAGVGAVALGVYSFLFREPSPEEAKRRIVALGYKYEPEGLFAAVRDGNLKAVNLFLLSGMDPNLYDRSGYTPLIFAIRRNHPRIIETLIEGGANPNLPDGRGYLPLNYAILQGSPELVKLLLKKGADPNRRDNDGFTALALAQKKNDPALIEIIQKYSGKL
jgi:ankyrin repeat protein